MIKKFNEFIKGLSPSDSPFTPSSVDGVDNNTLTQNPNKEIAGVKEVIEVIGLGKMKAKLDSGNSALNAIIVQDYYEKNGKVKFKFDGENKEYDVVKHIRIWHHGKSTERPVIRVDIKFKDKLYKDELVDLKISNLTGSKKYRCRMLLCKDFMSKANIIIDPSKEFRITDKDEIKKSKKHGKLY